MIDQQGATPGSPDPIASIGGLVAGLQREGGLDALVGKLRAAGLHDPVDSWVSTGGNQAVEPARLGEALGPETMNRLSASSGLSIEALLPMLAAFLPQIVDMLTPDGATPNGGLNGSMPDLGGLLGGLLGGTGGAAGQSGMPDLGGLLGSVMGGPTSR